MNLPYDTEAHYVTGHLHPFGRSIELFDKTVKLSDFGLTTSLASREKAHNRAGTPAFAGPEVYLGRVSDRTDQYALAVCYCLLRSGQLHSEGAQDMMETSLQDTLASHGFGLLSLHTQSFYAGGPLERAMPRFLALVAKERERLWTPSGEALARWWRERESVRVSATSEAGGLRIALDAARSVRGVQLIVVATAGAVPQLATPDTSARLERLDDFRWTIVLPQLAAGASELRVQF